jgi:hypothetical protein
VALDQAPNGDRAGVSRCSEGDHAGHVREVPQEEYSPSMYITQSCANRKEESRLIAYSIASIAEKLTPKKSQWLRCQGMCKLTCNSKMSTVLPHVQICCVITGVYFSAG